MAFQKKVIIRSFFSLFIVPFAFVTLCFRTACGETANKAYTCKTAHYTVHTSISPETARYIGKLMEKALEAYCEVTGYRGAVRQRFIIYAYATKKEYEAVARKQGFPEGITNGLYTPVPPAAIHLLYVTDQGRTPAATLLHEGTHQFIDQVMSFTVPAAARDILPPSQRRLISVPFWLNEGLATYMEGAITDDGRFEAGHVNGPRLRHLKRLIRAGEYPSFQEVMSRRYGEQFSVEDYAVAWGIVYVLNHERDSKRRPDKQGSLQRYLEACRLGFYADPAEGFLHDFLPGGTLLEGFEQRWNAHIAKQSPVVFGLVIAEDGRTLKKWERGWVESIRKLKDK